eukprot:NODE_77_length_23338_cov_0.319463.p8 type:complete len:207 gc:universal NODE_77_length_23338_cov_0.319463:17593-16973(-)
MAIESFHGYVKTLEDAMLVINSVETGQLPVVAQRLTLSERLSIESGSCFVWTTEKTNISRWTDGLYWSASRIHGHFLVYKQIVNKVKIENGLIKKTISFITLKKNRFHLICYYKKGDVDKLERPVDILNRETDSVKVSMKSYKCTANEMVGDQRQIVVDDELMNIGLIMQQIPANIGSWIDSTISSCHNEFANSHHVNQLNKYLQL